MSQSPSQGLESMAGPVRLRNRARLAQKMSVVLFMVLLSAPGLGTLGRAMRGTKVAHLEEAPGFSPSAWMSGAFQREYEAWFDENFATRNFYVRSSNQINFGVFREITFKDRAQITLGHRNSLFRTKYIHSYFGRDTMPPEVIERFATDL